MRYEKYDTVKVPTHTYLSVPLIMKKIGGIKWRWEDLEWKEYYYITGTNIIDDGWVASIDKFKNLILSRNSKRKEEKWRQKKEKIIS